MVHGRNRIPYWRDRRLTGLAGPDYDATISFGLPFEPEDSQYGESRGTSCRLWQFVWRAQKDAARIPKKRCIILNNLIAFPYEPCPAEATRRTLVDPAGPSRTCPADHYHCVAYRERQDSGEASDNPSSGQSVQDGTKRIASHPTGRSAMSLAGASLGSTRFDEVFHSTNRVKGYTHDFYKYPARFSPSFARFILDSLTEPGDYVLDPFMGGGTTIVEAMASGRHAIGSDVNELARFVTRVKTTPLSCHDIAEVRGWVQDVRAAAADMNPDAQPSESPVRNMPVAAHQFFAMATKLVEGLRFRRRQQFARCALVRVGQWGARCEDQHARCYSFWRRSRATGGAYVSRLGGARLGSKD